jgi:GNAT superfamily N-acetyltransferase
MSSAPFRITALHAMHDRVAFNSSSAPLDQYFHKQVMQDMRRRIATCFVALSRQRVVGYYTLASASLLLSDLPTSIGKKLPRYPTVPTVRMGRLAVDTEYKGQGLGGALLADALDRSCHSEIAAYALMVDAKDETSASFYLHHGFILLPNTARTLFLPLATASRLQEKRQEN